MSKKHFEAIAAALRNLPEDPTRGEVIRALAGVCAGFNSNFDQGRFIDACQPGEGE